MEGEGKSAQGSQQEQDSLQTSLLPDNIIFEGTHLGRVPSLKFEDWDLVDYENFPQLETTNLMKPKQNTLAGVIELEPRKWLCGVEKAGLLNLL